jgi:hypothetical protein
MKHFILCLVVVVLGSISAYSLQLVPILEQRLTPLEQFLNADGTVNLSTDFKGSLDARGWNMQLGEKGEPHFIHRATTDILPRMEVQAHPDDVYWDDRFSFRGRLSEVYAIAVIGPDLYVGSFGMAKWNGSEWSDLGTGSGLQGYVFALAVVGNDLYAAGFIPSFSNIAKWNGSTWSTPGSGMNGYVRALAALGTDLYAGGEFTTAGGISAKYIAKWNGTQWSALGNGMSNDMGGSAYVYTLAAAGTDLYAGGVFTVAGGVSARGIAKWNGTQWSSLGSGLSAAALSLAVVGSDLYVGGDFVSAGGLIVNGIAKWDGSTWSTLGSGMNKRVHALAFLGGDLYAGGWLTTAGGVNVNYIAKWNGTQWLSLGPGISGYLGSLEPEVRALAVMGTDLYVCGLFTRGGDMGANHIAKWSGSQWAGLGEGHGMSDKVNAFTVMGSDLYAGGDFTAAGGASANYIAKWNGVQWAPLGSSVNNNVNAVAVIGTDLYAGGWFTAAGGVSANYVAKWNGTQWASLGWNGSVVFSMVVSGTNLYVGSQVEIAKWNGIVWTALGKVPGNVDAIAISGENIYAGGWFTDINGVSANSIAKWNGTQWLPLGNGVTYNSGINGSVKALMVIGNDLYVGGSFDKAGEVSANSIAKWDGTQWSVLDYGSLNVRSFAVIGNNLYVAGLFNYVSFRSNIAKWDGTQWSALGSGIPTDVYALGVMGNDLYAGGNFIRAGNKVSAYIARWFQPLTSVEEEKSGIPGRFWLFQNYPNPFNPMTNISFSLPSRSFVVLKIFDAFGREVSVLRSEELPAGTYSQEWNARGLASGVYFYRLQAGSFTETMKLLLLR